MEVPTPGPTPSFAFHVCLFENADMPLGRAAARYDGVAIGFGFFANTAALSATANVVHAM